LAIALVVLAATGAWLWFEYRPEAVAAFSRLAGRQDHQWVREAHRWTSLAAAALAVCTFVVVLAARIHARTKGIVASLSVVVTVGAALFTGTLLPWDQLALGAVTVGNDLSGAQAVFGANVKFVIVDGRQISRSTYRFWAITHVVLGLLVGGAVVLAWLRTREGVPVPRDPAVEPLVS